MHRNLFGFLAKMILLKLSVTVGLVLKSLQVYKLYVFSPSQLIHNKVVDTSVVFPHRLGPPYKRALRNLMAEHLKKIIQDSGM